MTAMRVVAGALIRNGRVLLCHRSETRDSYPGVWDLPGGHVEQGEDARAALVRELAEELGIQARLASGAVTVTTADWHLTVYPVRAWSGEIRNTDLTEHDDLRWFDAEELEHQTLADPAYRPLLTRLCGEAADRSD